MLHIWKITLNCFVILLVHVLIYNVHSQQVFNYYRCWMSDFWTFNPEIILLMRINLTIQILYKYIYFINRPFHEGFVHKDILEGFNGVFMHPQPTHIFRCKNDISRGWHVQHPNKYRYFTYGKYLFLKGHLFLNKFLLWLRT